MKTDYKVGDKVRVLEDEANDSMVDKGEIGTIKALVDWEGDFTVDMEDGCAWYFKPEDIELVEDKSSPHTAQELIDLEDAGPVPYFLPDHVPHCPSHYKQGDIECIDAIYEALGVHGFIDYCRASAMKYLWRCDDKGDKDHDLKKAARFTQWAASKELYSQGIVPSKIPHMNS